jgi:hypothetical protein
MSGTLNTPATTDPLKANGFYSFIVTIPDDDVYSFTPKGPHGHIIVSTITLNHNGIFWYRSSAQSKIAGGSATLGLSTPLTGTTGVDGNTTVGASSNVLYIENRSGTAQEYTVTLITSNYNYE